MKQWTKEDFLLNEKWFHATSAKFFEKIIKEGIIADINRESELDFGYGFYLASSREWAEKYAKGFDNARILEFRFQPINILSGNKNYKFFEFLDDEFAEFVFSNRMYFQESKDNCFHNYDLVAGVMSDGTQVTDFEEFRSGDISKKELFRRLLLPREDWQLTLHSQALCDLVKPYKAYDLKGGEYDVSEYHKTI